MDTFNQPVTDPAASLEPGRYDTYEEFEAAINRVRRKQREITVQSYLDGENEEN